METISETLECYLRALTTLVQYQWDNPKLETDPEEEALTDAADKAWYAMPSEEHVYCDMYVALHYVHLAERGEDGKVIKRHPDYSTELAQQAIAAYRPQLDNYLSTATAALNARWLDQQARAEGKTSALESVHDDAQLHLWNAMNETDRKIAACYIDRFLSSCMDKDGTLFKKVPHFIFANELQCRAEIEK